MLWFADILNFSCLHETPQYIYILTSSCRVHRGRDLRDSEDCRRGTHLPALPHCSLEQLLSPASQRTVQASIYCTLHRHTEPACRHNPMKDQRVDDSLVQKQRDPNRPPLPWCRCSKSRRILQVQHWQFVPTVDLPRSHLEATQLGPQIRP